MLTCAYADPPYVGQARKHYACAEVDQADLIERLVSDFPDGWALSCTSTSLRTLLPLCPEDVRVMAWVKRFAARKSNVNPSYAWEPVIVRGGRRRPRKTDFMDDWFAGVPDFTGLIVGRKPYAFCVWLFRAMGLERGDNLVDLFPGSGAVTLAWRGYCGQADLAFG